MTAYVNELVSRKKASKDQPRPVVEESVHEQRLAAVIALVSSGEFSAQVDAFARCCIAIAENVRTHCKSYAFILIVLSICQFGHH